MSKLRHVSKWQWIFLFAVVLWTAFIWGNSLQPAVDSSAQSQSVVDLLKPLLSTLGIPVGLWQHLIRKAAHMFEFFVLCLFWLGVFRGKRFSWPLVLSLLTACVDESIQYFVPGRSNQLSDVVIDFLGALIAATVCAGIMQLIRRHKKTP